MVKLSNETLDELPRSVAKLNYDRSQLSPGIVHVGVGNFHRSHQAVFLNDFLNSGGDPAWGIRGAGVRKTDTEMRDALCGQDWLYSVVEVNFEALEASIIGAMTDFVPVQPHGNGPLIEAMAEPKTKIVSLTVTEGGYFLDADGKFDLAHPNIIADIANPNAPHSVFGAIINALSMRKAEGVKPFTVMSCDNLPGNGDVTRDVVVNLANAMDRDLGVWINETVSFPNGMVDRITPATGRRVRDLLAEKFGIEDNFPVVCEPFRQWVLEDKFVNGRPELETVGVTFTDDIHQFERMKIRILNGGHAIIAYPSALLGIEYTHEALATPLIRAFLRKVLLDDVIPHVASVPGFTPNEYLELICTRFENPGVADTISRLCFDGSNRQPKFILPSIKDNLDSARVPHGLTLCSALWCRYCTGEDEHGNAIAANDPNWTSLQSTARRALDEPSVWLEQEEVFGSLSKDREFADAFASTLQSVCNLGTEQSIRAYLNASS